MLKPCKCTTVAAAIALVAIGTGVFVASSSADDKKAAALAIGAPAPEFQLKDQDGKFVNLSEFKDKVVVLEWFNDGCPFVVKHYKNGDMNQTASKYEAKGVVWIAVNSTNQASIEHNKKVAGDWKMERAILDDHEGTVGHLYSAKTTPHMYVINKGTLVYMGAIDSKSTSEASDIAGSENYVAKALDEVLAGKPVSTPETKPYGCSVKYGK